MTILRLNFFGWFFVILLTTEFFYIDIGGGVARIYHFLAVIIVFMLLGSVEKLFRSKVFQSLLLFAAINLIAVFFSDNSEAALASFLSFLANLAVAMAAALILIRNKVDLSTLKKIIFTVTVVSVLLGLLQIIMSKVGVILSLSDMQDGQIAAGFGPGFRTEANTFAKYMLLPLLLLIPDLMKKKISKTTKYLLVIFAMGFLMNFTRTALIGFMVVVVFILFWYMSRNRLGNFSKIAAYVSSIVILMFALITSGVVPISEYATHKMDSFFDQEEIVSGGSSTYRIASMERVIESTYYDDKRFLIGNGWGQTYVFFGGKYVQAGGGDIINVFGYGGISGVFAYLIFMYAAYSTAKRNAKKNNISVGDSSFAEGIMFALIGIFIASQMSGYIITPELWLIMGVCVYLGLPKKRQTHNNLRLRV